MFNLTLSLLPVNVTGLRDTVKKKAVYSFPDFFSFKDVIHLKRKINFWPSQWGNDVWLVQGAVSLGIDWEGSLPVVSDCRSLFLLVVTLNLNYFYFDIIPLLIILIYLFLWEVKFYNG